MNRCLAVLALVLLVAFPMLVAAQKACPIAPPVAPLPEPLLFTPQQEMELGAINVERVQRDYQVVEDDALNAYLQGVGERLAKFAPTDLKPQFQLVDVPIVNAFTLPGGHIYVTRKLVAFVHSEDELAGVLGHELGHAISRDSALTMTRLFRKILNVDSVGDRRDILQKYNELLDKLATKRVNFDSRERDEQLSADQMGVYLMARAGYDPNAFAEVWDRLAETKGKTGGWLSDLFGYTKPETKRLRESLKAASGIPPECRGASDAGRAAEFRKWQSDVVEYSFVAHKSVLHGVKMKTRLEPPLRPDITTLRFSGDGQYVLAQDDNSIYVLTREPFAFKFRIDAPDAYPAHFSPDNKAIVFHTAKLRAEKWNIEGERTWVREITVQAPCLQTALSPDGEFLACYNGEFELRLLQTSDSTVVYSKKNFYTPTYFDLLNYYLRLQNEDYSAGLDIVRLVFSPDGKYLIAAHGASGGLVRFIGAEDGSVVPAGGSSASAVALDLQTKQPINLPSRVKDLLQRHFSFLGPGRLVGQRGGDNGDKSMVVTFPEGDVVMKDLVLGGNSLEGATKGDYVLLRPIKDYPLGIVDLAKNKVVMAIRTSAYDIYGDVQLGERRTGAIGLYKGSVKDSPSAIAECVLLQSPLGRLRAFDVSPDLKFVAVSQRRRGAIWNIEKGERIAYVRGFRGASIDDHGTVLMDFPEFDKNKRAIGGIDLASGQGGEVRAVEEGPADKRKDTKPEADATKNDSAKKSHEWNVFQTGPFLITQKPTKKGEWAHDVTVEVSDVRTGNLLWQRRYQSEAPTFEGVAGRESTMVLSWNISTGAAKDDMRNDPALKARAAKLEEKQEAYLLHVVDARTGDIRGKVLVETNKGSFKIESAAAAGDWLVVNDNHNRVLVYSIASGEQKGKFFGSYAVLSKESGLLAVENNAGQVSIYSLANMEKRDEYAFPSELSRGRFSPDGQRLFVLTEDQSVYVLDMNDPVGQAAGK